MIRVSQRSATLTKSVGFAIVFVLSTILASCGGVQPSPPEGVSDDHPTVVEVDAPLLERGMLWDNPDKASPKLSPDGTRIAYLAPVDGVLNIWVGPANDPSAAKPITKDSKRGIRIYFWAYSNDHVIFLQDAGGDENWRVYAVNLKTNESKDLTPIEGTRAQIEAVSHRFPEEILIGINDRDPKLHDIYRVNILTGDRKLVQENPGFMGFVTDDDYAVRFAMMGTPDGGTELFSPFDKEKMKKKGKKKKRDKKSRKSVKPAQPDITPASPIKENWVTFLKIPFEDSMTTQPVGFDKTGRILYLLDSRGRNTAAFATLNLDTHALEIVAEDPRADLSDLKIHPTQYTPQAVAFTYERKEWKFLDNEFKSDFEILKKTSDGDAEIVSRTIDDRQWLIAFVQDIGPIKYYHYNRDKKTASFLFTNRKQLEGVPLAPMRPEVIQSRDGLNLVSYITLPPGSDADADGRPEKALPTVLLVHGGPWSRVSWGYNPIHQWLANRGYAVLDVNFRGSTGLGKTFLNAGNKEWAGKMHDDLLDAVGWAVQNGIAIPKQVAVLGGSYGGYATLVGLTYTPETFACGVDIVGPSNLVTLLSTVPPYWAPLVEMFATRVGDHRTEEGRAFLDARSPLNMVDAITKPLLIGQGANDPRVKQAESDQIVKAMNAKNIPVTYVLYPDEGHGFARPQNRLSFWAVTEAFLSKCLGGRFEEIGDDFEGSSIQIPSGAENIPNLDQSSFQ